MRTFFGMILGAMLLVAVAFIADSQSVGSSTTGSGSTIDHRQMVNWDVVSDRLQIVRQRAREAWTTLSHKMAS